MEHWCDKLMKEERFSEEGFNAFDFVESLSVRIVPPPAEWEAKKELFDPTPVHTCFDMTLEKLRLFQEDVNLRTEELLTECQKVEGEYSSILNQLSNIFEQTKGPFSSLDSSVDKLSKRTLQIGKTLEKVEKEKQRALQTQQLVIIVQSLNSEDVTEDITEFQSPDPSFEVCAKMKDLRVIYKELGNEEATRKAKSAIKNLSSTMKTNLQAKLHSAQKRKDIAQMREAVEKFAAIFPDKDKKLWIPLQHYIQGLDIPALDKTPSTAAYSAASPSPQHRTPPQPPLPPCEEPDSSAIRPEDSKEKWKPIPNPARIVENYQQLNDFFDEVLKILKDQREIIEVAFAEHKVMALETLISDVFSKAIQGFTQSLLTASLSNLTAQQSRIHRCVSSDIYLSTLAHSILKIKQIEEEFQEYVPVLNWHPLYEPIYSSHWTNYLDIEIRSITEFLKEEIEKDVQLQQKKKDEERLKREQQAESQKFGFIGRLFVNEQDQEVQIRLLPSISHKYLSRLSEGIYRVTLVTEKDEDVPRNLTKLFVDTVVNEFGEKYMGEALEKVLEKLERGGEPVPEDFFDTISLVNKNILSIHNKFFKEIWPEIEERRDRLAQKACLDAKQEMTTQLEDKIIRGLTSTLDVTVNWISQLLSTKQRPTDYLPQSGSKLLGNIQLLNSENETEKTFGSVSTACNEVCSFLSKTHATISKSLDGRNLEYYMHELGSRLLTVILNHIRNYTVGGFGALSLMLDLRKYRDTISSWKVVPLIESYKFLHDLEKLFLVEGPHLKSFLESSPLRQMDIKELETYIHRRSDYPQLMNSWKPSI